MANESNDENGNEPAGPGPELPPVLLAAFNSLRDRVRRLNPKEPEDSHAFRAGMVLLAAHVAGCRDLPFLARLSGVPLTAVEGFAGNLLATGAWRVDGTTAYRWVAADEDGRAVVRSAPFLDPRVAEENHDTGFSSDVVTAVGGPRRIKTDPRPVAGRDPRAMIPAAVRRAGPEAERKFLEHFADADPRPSLPAAIRQAGPAAERTFIAFFVDPARSIGTRLAYLRAAGEFFAWLDARGLRLGQVRPPHLAAWAEGLTAGREAPAVRHALTAVRKLFDRLVEGGVLETNPAAAGGDGTGDGPADPDREPPSELEPYLAAAVETGRRELRRHNPGKPEDSHEFRAGLVLLAAFAAGGHYDLPLLARVTGVPLGAVEWYAGNLVTAGTWRVDGTTAYRWADPDDWTVVRSAPYLDFTVAEENGDTDFCSDVITAVGDWYTVAEVIL